MNNIFNFSIVSSFLGLWITTHVPESFELILGFFLIFTFGMIHGSNDLLIVNKILKNNLNYSKFALLIAYLFIVSIAILIFYLAPSLAMILFIIFSAYHFGEQHWDHRLSKSNTLIKSTFYFSFGILILYLLFAFNDAGVKLIVSEITGYEIPNLYSNTILIVLGSFIGLVLINEFIKNRLAKEVILKELFTLVVLAIIFSSSSLIWGFSIYFILWHSIPSLIEQITFIYGDVKTDSTLKYCKSALPYWVISLIGMGVLYLIFSNEKQFYALFFAFIAAVTFPHAVVMLRMFSKKKAQP
ncbi:MAG: Brp/Blh family beta-carotene 15,15'-dioxygenase [Flavobacteriaceae bacterium]|jgi:beta-carotene 15,15'-dioxygenase|nr:Brp/Blh family beta-carotene 15,15'-dioxygenase [Flavobacteriaceae bacterium]